MTTVTQRQQWSWYSDEFEAGASRPKGIAYKADPLALVLMMKAQNKANYDIAHELKHMSEIFATKEDAHLAQKIRKYYRNRLVIQTLKGKHEMSNFRKDLYEFVDSDNIYYLREDFIPMVTKLPDFYEEDLMYDDFKKFLKTDRKTYEVDARLGGEFTLYPVRKHHRKTQKCNILNYFFADGEKQLYKIMLDPKNPLLHLFDRLFEQDKINFIGNRFNHDIRGTDLNMFILHEWEVQ